MSVSSGAVVI